MKAVIITQCDDYFWSVFLCRKLRVALCNFHFDCCFKSDDDGDGIGLREQNERVLICGCE